MYGIVFAGQGAQRPGMGKSLYEASPAARAVFDRAGDGIKYDCFEADAERLMQTEVTQPAVYTMDMAAYAALCEALGIEGVLGIGAVAGVASGNALGAGGALGAEAGADGRIASVAGAVVDGAPGIEKVAVAGAGAKVNADGFPGPSAVAGFSLGEYAAFTAAGVIDSVETGIAVVKKRSLLMKEAGLNPDGSRRGAMAAGMGGRDAVLALVEKARGADVLEAVNFNSPQQTVVAGDVAAVERFDALAKEDRGLGVKAVPLSVSGAFHSPIMRPAAEGLADALAGFAFSEPTLPVYLNATGGTFDEYGGTEGGETGRPAGAAHGQGNAPGLSDAAHGQGWNTTVGGNEGRGLSDPDARAKAVMVRQVHSPVQWQKTIEAMASAGIDVFIEVGPGKTLSGLVRKIVPGAAALHVEDAESLSETVKYVIENEAKQ